ncbi:MOSC domain-containing protein [Chondromyces apiculatus]|uniref:MOSC domain-containing protein n=1 Tax=Chondromyces apiculatus DSM 436 TaxID=1192034 RepID=A0A017TI74_9BACT|nr:MOSC domain-containing protein [Chondromyces apiculatus]EYF08336.1 Hypothetical protein CAP_6097 [Chondromyces apiculatus DSM 436]
MTDQPLSEARVEAVSARARHELSKPVRSRICLVAGRGVEGDAHAGEKVQHLYDARKNPERPNLRQVHLIAGELHDALRKEGFEVHAGQMGENITTRGVDLLGLPRGARLHLGAEAVVEVTGLREPCKKLDRLQKGLMKAVMGRDEAGAPVFKIGVMGIVLAGGEIKAGDRIRVELPELPHEALQAV